MIGKVYSLCIVLAIMNTSNSEKNHGYFGPGHGPVAGRPPPYYGNNHGDVEWIRPPYQDGRQGRYVLPPTDAEFSYSREGGPDNWKNKYPECGEHHQSPINIAHARTQLKPPLQFYNYFDNQNQAEMNNTGKAAEVKMLGKQNLPQLSGGPLNSVYEFRGLHFHWGRNDNDGSEHQIGGVQFTMEAHVVHIKKSYGTIEEARKNKDGLAVVSFMLQVAGKNNNNNFNRVVSKLVNIYRAGITTQLSMYDALLWFKSRVDDNYFTYRGSLTTPPCSEVVTWIVFEKPIFIGALQAAEFRRLRSTDNTRIDNNHRGTQYYVHPDVVYVHGVH